MAVIRRVNAALGTGDNDGTSWPNAYRDSPGALQVALNAWLTGDKIYVHMGASSPSAETTAADLTLSSTAADTKLDPIRIFGVDKDNSDAPVETPSTPTVEVTGVSSLTITCHAIWQGLYLAVADGGNDFNLTLADLVYHFISCRLKAGNVGGDDFFFNGNATEYLFEKSIITVGDQMRNMSAIAIFKDTVISILGNGPHITTTTTHQRAEYDGCNFSGSTAGKVFVSVQTGRPNDYWFRNCKMPATWIGKQGTFPDYHSAVRYLNCDDSDDYPRTEIYTKAGDVKTDTGVFISSGGWSDETANASGVPLSLKLTPTDEIHEGGTLNSFPPIDEYLDDTPGSHTFTVQLIDDFENPLQNDRVWLEVFYSETAGQVKQSLGTSRVVPGDTPADLDAGTGLANWTGEPAKTIKPRSVELALTVTTGLIGWYSAVVRLAKYEANDANGDAGAGLWVAPLLTVS